MAFSSRGDGTTVLFYISTEIVNLGQMAQELFEKMSVLAKSMKTTYDSFSHSMYYHCNFQITFFF